MFMKSINVIPMQVIHSDKQWTKETGGRVANMLGQSVVVSASAYGILPEEPVEPFIGQVESGEGDIMMTGHGDFLLRARAKLLCGDEQKKVLESGLGNGTTFCLEKTSDG